MRRIRLYLVISIIIFISQPLLGTVYYVDATIGNDSSNGMSSSSAWRTIARVNSAMGSFQPGDSILFKRGETWRDASLEIQGSGGNGNPIIFDAYGSGNKPTFAGGREIYSRWLIHDVTIRNICVTDSADSGIYFSGGNGFRYRIRVEYCDITNAGNCGIYFDQTDTFTVDNCNVSYPTNAGIVIYGSTNYRARNGIISNCVVVDDHTASNDGITIHTNANSGTIQDAGENFYIYNCVVHGFNEQGFDCDTAARNILIRNCETYDNASIGGLSYAKANRIYIENFYIHDEDDEGFYFQGVNHCVIVKSVFRNTAGEPLVITQYDVTRSSDIYLAHNTFVADNSTQKSRVEFNGDQYANIIKSRNNIFKHATNPTRLGWGYVSGATPANTNSDLNYSCFWDSNNTPGDTHFYAGSSAYNFAGWRSTWRQDANSLWNDPYLDTYLTPRAGSPCINAGGWLTAIESPSGSGTQFRVTDAKWFHDGFGLTTGSEIQLQGQETSARVTDVDYGTNTITVNQNVSWVQGNGVAFAYSGYAPDIGAREYAGAQSVMASASGSPTSGQAPLTVNFTGSASGGTAPYTYSWDFGDGQSSSAQSPSHTYSTAGNYTAILTVRDNQGANDTDSVAITATATPPSLSASLSASPTSGQAPLTVNFTGSASGGTAPYTYSWNFGDGQSSSAQSPSHAYSSPGVYNATLSVTDAANRQAHGSLSITVTSRLVASNLIISSATGSPAPGNGGRTNPEPGRHSYPIGSIVQIEAIPDENYRFSYWDGDVDISSSYNSSITIIMNSDKSLTANFSTRCGDVNGDLMITPADAQAIFEIYLGRMESLTNCQRENADVNCDGTKTQPKITPADAQIIFDYFLGKAELPCGCSGNSRSEVSAAQIKSASKINISINDIISSNNQEIMVPLFIDNPLNLDAFGFEMIYPSDRLEFNKIIRTELTTDFQRLEANPVAHGIVRVGGYKIRPIKNARPGKLLILAFKVIKDLDDPLIFTIMKPVDDLSNSNVHQGRFFVKKTKVARDKDRKLPRESKQKRFD